MANNYQGTSSGIAQSPSPAPAPRSVPTLSIPAGNETRTIESITQQMKTKADFIAHIQGSAGLDLPALPASGGTFTAPVNTALGGTITPSGSAHIADGTRFVIQIQLGGAVGVATFKTSVDGGNTYGALQTTAASMTDATSGITLAFAGTFTANGTAAFRSAFTPLAQWFDTAGNGRSAVDHLGYQGAWNLSFREFWTFNTVTSVGANIPFASYTSWMSEQTGTGSVNYGLGQDPTASIPFPYSYVSSPGAGGAAWLGQGNFIMYPHSGVCAAFNWFGQINAVGASNVTQYAGMGGGSTTLHTRWNAASNAFTDGVFFTRVSGLANWQINSETASTVTTVDSGIAATTALTRFRIELYGSGTPTGAVAKFFINSAFAGQITTNLPAAALKFCWGNIATGTPAGDNTHIVGPIWMNGNYQLVVPGL